MKTSPWIIFILSFLLLFILILAYYLPKIPNDSDLLFNPIHDIYYGPGGFFEGFMTNGNGHSYGRNDTLLFFIELIGIFVFSIVLTSILTSISKDPNVILNLPVKSKQSSYRRVLELNISIIVFLIIGIILYLGLTTRVLISRIESIILIIATIISSYNIFFYGIFIHNRGQEAEFKQVLFSSKSKYEFYESFFIVLNFIVFSASFLSIFFICTKSFDKTDKFDLVDKVDFIYNVNFPCKLPLF